MGVQFFYSEDVLDDPPPLVYFQDFGDSGLIFKLKFWVENMSRTYIVSELRHEILDAFREKGLEMPFPVERLSFERERREAGLNFRLFHPFRQAASNP